MPKNTSGALPLTESTFLIMLSLAPQARHGYAIMQDVEDISEGRVQLSTGTMYGALRRLLADGWIERVPTDEVEVAIDGRNQKFYRLTPTGEAILGAELDRLKQLIEVGELRRSSL